MTRLRFHVYVPEYELQGPTLETDRPLSQIQKQKLVNDFFKWLKGDQTKLKAQIAKDEVHAIIKPGKGFVSVSALALRREIIAITKTEPREGLTIAQLKKIKSGRLYAAKWFK